MGLGRIVHPVQASGVGAADGAQSQPGGHRARTSSRIPTLRHVYFDISWDEVAKYLLSSPAVTKRAAEIMNRYPDRFLFGSDVVAPKDTTQYYAVYEMLQAVVGTAHARGQRQGAHGELPAALRRCAPESAGLGEGEGLDGAARALGSRALAGVIAF